MEEMNSFSAQRCPPQYIGHPSDRYVRLWIFEEMEQIPLLSGRKEAEIRVPGNQQLWGPLPTMVYEYTWGLLLLIYACAGSLLLCVGFL